MVSICNKSVHLFLALLNLTSLIEFITCENIQADYLVYHDPNSCTKYQNRTFSSTSLGCVNCHKDKDKNKGYFSGCSCPANHVLVFVHNEELQKGTRTKCVQCPENAVSFDQRSCVACVNDTKPDEFTGKCSPCPPGYILSYKTLTGAAKKRSECLQCSDGFTPSPSGESCIPCHSSFPNPTKGLCKCPEDNVINGICFVNAEIAEPSIDRSSLFKMEYDTGHRVDSPFLRDNLLSSFYLCKYQRNATSCQLLANMCTLQLHSYGDETNSCTLYRLATTEPYHIPPSYIPKLYYLSIEAPSLLVRASSIPLQFDMNLGETTSDVNITVSRVTVDGTFQGLSLLNEIIPCNEPVRVQKYARKFGTTFKTSCSIPIQGLWEKFSNGMEFLDPYLSFKDGKETKLYPVPVKILNFKQRGVKINEMDDNHQWQLVRRFFFVDTIDSLENVEEDGKFKSSKLIRYLEKISIGIQLQNSNEPGKIYVPLLTLSYNEMDLDAYRRNEPANFEFTVEYIMDMSRSLEDVKISVGVISSLTVLWAAMQAWSWNRRSGRPYIDITTIANLLIYTCGHLADAFFVVCFGTSLFWFFFYKKQAAVHVLLPQPEQERLIRDLLISAFSLKIVEVMQLITRQVAIDIFFVDWERPRARHVIQSPNSVNKSAGSSSVHMTEAGNNNPEKSEGNVSIWRSYFIANEWNEIQSTRKIHVAAQIIITIFLLEIVGIKYWGLLWPEGTVNPGPEYRNIPYCMSARFAVGSLVFLIIGSIQWILRVGLVERFVANKIQDFVDICTLANVSVFILAADQYGYYIHGRSVHGFSDTSMQAMIEQLSREEEDLCGRRGLLPSTDQQTFLISVPSSFRSVYNQVLQPLYASSSVNVNVGKGRAQLGNLTTKIQLNTSKPTSTMLNLSVHAYHSMNRFLTAFLEHALSDLDYDVTDKSFFEATFDMEFGDVTQDRAIFYTDNGHSFDSVLLYGNERTLFLFNLYTFVFTEILSHNFLLAGIVTYFTDMALKYTRNYLGKRNLARKTLIDSRFLI